jgi:hypothetical protein
MSKRKNGKIEPCEINFKQRRINGISGQKVILRNFAE